MYIYIVYIYHARARVCVCIYIYIQQLRQANVICSALKFRAQKKLPLICTRAARRLDEYPPRWCSKSASHVQHRLYFSRFIFPTGRIREPSFRFFAACTRVGTRLDRMHPFNPWNPRFNRALANRVFRSDVSRYCRQKKLLCFRERSSFRVKEHPSSRMILVPDDSENSNQRHTSLSSSFPRLIRGFIRRSIAFGRESAFHSLFSAFGWSAHRRGSIDVD